MSDTTYNGWTNWATWNMALWVDNDEPQYKAKLAVFKYCTVTPNSVEEFCREIYPHGTPDMGDRDLVTVDWCEIAENWQQEMDEED